MNAKIVLKLDCDEVYLLVQGCSLGLQNSGILSTEERLGIRRLIQKITRELKNEAQSRTEPD